MVSRNQIIFILGTRNKPMTINDIASVVDEDGEGQTVYWRVRSFLVKMSPYFLVDRANKRNLKYSLSSIGRRRFEEIEHSYNIYTDSLME